jgi:microcystin-dependent protein
MTAIATGSVISFAGDPGRLATMEALGWIKCDGRALSRADYPELYLAIGTTYGGNGNPNFNLPDMRGYFQRGVDDGAGRDPDRGGRVQQGSGTAVGDRVGSLQSDQLKNHKHNWDHFFYWLSYSGSDIAVHQPADSWNLQNNTRQATNNDGGGAETRPKNVYTYFLIASGVHRSRIVGVGTDKYLWLRDTLTSGWVQVPNSGSVIGVTQMLDGRTLGIGTDNLLYTRDDLSGPWVQVPNSGAVIGVAQLLDGRILGIGTDKTLYTRDRLTSAWVQVPSSGPVIAVTQLFDGRILGVGPDNLLCTRADLNSPWTQVENSGSVIGVAQLADGRILGIGTDNLLYTRDTVTSPWVQIANSGSVIAVAQT